MSEKDIFNDYGVKIKLKSSFTNIREALTRIGIANYKTKTLTQSCHIFHKRGEYAIMHFKEMFLFENKKSDFTIEDESRRNRIVKILEDWGLIEIDEDFNWDEEPCAPVNSVSIISRATMKDEKWTLVKKFTLGKR